LARIYEAAQLKHEAIKEYQLLIRLDPKNNAALTRLQLLAEDTNQ